MDQNLNLYLKLLNLQVEKSHKLRQAQLQQLESTGMRQVCFPPAPTRAQLHRYHKFKFTSLSSITSSPKFIVSRISSLQPNKIMGALPQINFIFGAQKNSAEIKVSRFTKLTQITNASTSEKHGCLQPKYSWSPYD
jgi:hypothetical protein